jgi:hypothetical protein
MLYRIFAEFTRGGPELLYAMGCEFLFAVTLLVLVQALQYFRKDLMALYRGPVILKTLFYSACILLIFLFGGGDAKEFIYFQF